MTQNTSGNRIGAVERDHREVEQMLAAVTSASGAKRRDAVQELAAKLRAHEAAEQKVVHPLTAEEGTPRRRTPYAVKSRPRPSRSRNSKSLTSIRRSSRRPLPA